MKSSAKPKMKDYTFIYISKWKIEGFEDYAFLTDKRLFNYRTNRFSKKRVKKYSTGFTLDGDFYTLETIKDWIVPVEKLSQNNSKIIELEINELILELAS